VNQAAPKSRMGAPPERLSTSVLVAYALPMAGFMAVTMTLSLYLLKYATDVLLIAPGVMGVVLFAGRVWDAVTDPVVGRLSDRSRSQVGRRRFWIFASVPPTAIAFVMLWAPPASLGSWSLALWIGVALLAFSTAQTMFYVPYYALGIELSTTFLGAVVVEQVFSLPGMGSMLLLGIQQRDYPNIQGVLIVSTLLVLLTGFLADILQRLLDPRLREARR